MKEQYVGDISDYRKYALLRALSAGGAITIGVCWMLTPPDNRADGNKIAYLSNPGRFRKQDPALFDLLQRIVSGHGPRRLGTLEEAGVVPEAVYFSRVLSDDLGDRHLYMDECHAALSLCSIVFFDPDNGLEVALKKGRKNSSKYLYLDEIEAFYSEDRSVLIYQHFPRVERERFIARCVHRLRGIAVNAAIWVYQTKHVVFILLVPPKLLATVGTAAELACDRWDPDFIHGRKTP